MYLVKFTLGSNFYLGHSLGFKNCIDGVMRVSKETNNCDINFLIFLEIGLCTKCR